MARVMDGGEMWSSPLEVIRERFGHEINGNAKATPEVLQQLFRDLPSVERIPYLFRGTKSGSLVRFVCFVQDVLEQEMYFFRYGRSGNKTAICADVVTDPEIESQPLVGELLSERLPLYCTTPPGLSTWMITPEDPTAVSMGDNLGTNRKRTALGAADEPMDVEEKVERSKRGRTPGSQPRNPQASADVGLNLPLPTDAAQGAFGVVVKLYDREMMGRPLLNQLIEVVGIVEDGGPIDNSVVRDTDEEPRLDLNVKRLHAISARTVNPLLADLPMSGICAERDIPSVKDALCRKLPSLRTGLIEHLSSPLGGDTLAAEYLLAALISGVTRRTDSIVLGKLSLNLVLPEDLDSANVVGAVKALWPRVAVVPVTIENLNSEMLVPTKNYASNRLVASRLQLPAGTALIVDETALRPGQLNERGLKNLAALRELSERRLVPYDFQFYNMEVATDVQVICLSYTKSLVPCDVVLPCFAGKPSGPPVDTPADRSDLRAALMLLADRDWEHDVPDEVSDLVQKQFVDARRQDPVNVTQLTLHGWLSLSRLQAKSHGETSLSADRWRKTMDTDAQCRQRAMPART